MTYRFFTGSNVGVMINDKEVVAVKIDKTLDIARIPNSICENDIEKIRKVKEYLDSGKCDRLSTERIIILSNGDWLIRYREEGKKRTAIITGNKLVNDIKHIIEGENRKWIIGCTDNKLCLIENGHIIIETDKNIMPVSCGTDMEHKTYVVIEYEDNKIYRITSLTGRIAADLKGKEWDFSKGIYIKIKRHEIELHKKNDWNSRLHSYEIQRVADTKVLKEIESLGVKIQNTKWIRR